jgi:hypothetical protein
MTSLGLPFQGDIRYYIENSYGACSDPTTTGLPISIKVLDAKISLSDKHKGLRGIDKANVCYLLEQTNDWSFHLEYIPQCGDTLFEDAFVSNPTTCNNLQSLTFYLTTNICSSPTGPDASAYLICGAVGKTVKISSSINNEYIYAMDFDVSSVTCSTPTGAAPTPLVGALCAFNIAGSIKDGSGNNLAYITNAIDVTIDTGVKGYFDHDSLDKQYAIPGELNISGSVDISLDEGGCSHLTDVVSQVTFSIVLSLGSTGCPEITLNNCSWKSSEIDVNISGDIMKENAPFDAKTFSYATV